MTSGNHFCLCHSEDKKAVSEVLLFDSTFKVAGGVTSTGEAHGLTISSDIQDR